MVCVPGSLSGSGFQHESHEEARADLRSGKPASSTDGTEEGPATDLEEKPLPPPQVPSGTPADSDLRRDRLSP
ncbi:Hypothetical protein PHPALM_968 [Phytophthora palmivora]|uniref:Uncharacterized protein n=1 Tax=Phytophthora palmivora TaxID=4796 RepID=A0A2P4YTI4_9STRA|nr:Hypothetical protein PHPALM_968 [Phytophthora palmivora]